MKWCVYYARSHFVMLCYAILCCGIIYDICLRINTHACVSWCAQGCICMYTNVCVCVCIYAYIYIIHTYIHRMGSVGVCDCVGGWPQLLRPASVRGWHSTSWGLPASVGSSFVGSSLQPWPWSEYGSSAGFQAWGAVSRVRDIDAATLTFPIYVIMWERSDLACIHVCVSVCTYSHL